MQADELRVRANSFNGQAVQLDAPEAEKEPAGQKEHDLWPDLSWNRPAGHRAHCDPSMKEPGWQMQLNPRDGAARSTQTALAGQVALMQPLISTQALTSLRDNPGLQTQVRSEVRVGAEA